MEYWEAGHCKKSGGSGGNANELGVENVGGVFVFLMAGVLLGFLVSICEFVLKARKNARKDEVGAFTPGGPTMLRKIVA